MLAIIVFSTFSLDASEKFSSFSRKVVHALCQENRIHQDIIETRLLIDKKRTEAALLEGFVAQYAQRNDLEEHEYVKKFNARGQALCLRSEIAREVDVLRWFKMQSLGLAFAQTKAVLQKEIGEQIAVGYDQFKVAQYAHLAKFLVSSADVRYPLAIKKPDQKDVLVVISAVVKELK